LWLIFLALTVAVLTRHGVDTSLLLATLVFQVGAVDVTIAAAAGTFVAAVAAWGWARHAHRLRPPVFFALTTIVLVVAALVLGVDGIRLLRVGLADMSGVVR
jgi:hypothetical protein